mmetsp:Transcript_13091/g.30280  ORF Transcript_13091/g.30280 Transcript_13091/m.30280 type:complete len:280 (-) Transcript_13091:548-1387(-)
MEQDVARLEIVVDDLLLLLVEVTQSRKHLHDDRTGLAFGEQALLFQELLEVPRVAVLQHRAEPVRRYLEDVEEADDAGVRQLLLDLVLARGVLHVVGSLLLRPRRIQLVDLARDLLEVLEVESEVHFREASLPEEVQKEVAVVQERERVVLRRCLVLNALDFADEGVLFALELLAPLRHLLLAVLELLRAQPVDLLLLSLLVGRHGRWSHCPRASRGARLAALLESFAVLVQSLLVLGQLVLEAVQIAPRAPFLPHLLNKHAAAHIRDPPHPHRVACQL